MLKIAFLVSLLAIFAQATANAEEPVRAVQGNFNGDNITDRAYIYSGTMYRKYARNRVIPEDGSRDRGSKVNDYVIIKLSKENGFYLPFPFVESLKTISEASHDVDLLTCYRNGTRGLFAISEEGAVYIYSTNRGMSYRNCFE